MSTTITRVSDEDLARAARALAVRLLELTDHAESNVTPLAAASAADSIETGVYLDARAG